MNFKNWIQVARNTRWLKSESKLSAMIRVKAGRPMVNYILRMLPAIGVTLSLSRVKTIIVFLGSCYQLQRKTSMRMLVITLKALYVVTQQAIGGHRLTDMSPLGTRISRTKAVGLPRKWIPMIDRTKIRKGDHSVLRFYLSLFSVYRILEVPGKLKLNTITDPGTMDPSFLAPWSEFVSIFCRNKLHRVVGTKIPMVAGLKNPLRFLGSLRAVPKLIPKSSPTVIKLNKDDLSFLSSSPTGIILAAKTWLENPSLYAYLKDWCKMTGNSSIINRIEKWASFPDFLLTGRTGTLGKLGFKEEAAGKVRVFAMVDPFTQWLFKPLWDRIVQILERIPQDGTKDQYRPLHKLMKDYPKGPFFSFDLSAATDRLPVTLQTQLLAPFIGMWGAQVWMYLLVGRGYKAYNKQYDIDQTVHYAVGQPMGALTSWGLLALTHHALVQFAAYRAGVTGRFSWFAGYAVLGDDVVIAHRSVAHEYLKLMSEIGVLIGLPKSLVSPKGTALEFAKRTFWRGHDVSPVPFTEMWVAHQMLAAGLEFARKYTLTSVQWLTFNGVGYKSKGSMLRPFLLQGKKTRDLLLAYISPSGVESRSWLDFFRSKSMISNWGIPSYRLAQVTDILAKAALDRISQSLDSRNAIWAFVRNLVEVDRTSEYYGTTRKSGGSLRIHNWNPEPRKYTMSVDEQIYRLSTIPHNWLPGQFEEECRKLKEAGSREVLIEGDPIPHESISYGDHYPTTTWKSPKWIFSDILSFSGKNIPIRTDSDPRSTAELTRVVNSILEDLKSDIYRVVFKDVLIELRDIRALIESLKEDLVISSTAIGEVADRVRLLEDKLDLLPLPTELYKRKLETASRLRDARQVMIWYHASRPLRATNVSNNIRSEKSV